jgi:hypothetical protein
MNNFWILLAIIFISVVVYQAYVSRRIMHAPYYTNQQRLWQIMIIWVLPLIGAALCHLMLNEMEPTPMIQAQSNCEDSAGGNGSHHTNIEGD